MLKDEYPSKLLEDAVDAIGTLPGVGRRSALRLALHLLKQPAENVHHFTAAINALRDNTIYCKNCGMVSDSSLCSICSDSRRDHGTICVVESVREVMSIEKTAQYHGVYHVLGGVLDPINGVGVSDLRVPELIERVRALRGADRVEPAEFISSGVSSSAILSSDVPSIGAVDSRDSSDGEFAAAKGSPVEVIFALSGDVEGETTSFYLYRQLQPLGVKMSTLARGLGFGDGIEYADEMTLGRSIVNRQEFKP